MTDTAHDRGIKAVNQKSFRTLDQLLDSAFSTEHLSVAVKSQLELEKFKSVSRILPSLLLGNLFLMTVCVATVNEPKLNGLKLSILVASFSITIGLLALAAFARSRNRAIAKPDLQNFTKYTGFYVLAALLLGLTWSVVPAALPLMSTKLQVISAAASLAGVFCVAGFALSPVPKFAAAFMTPILISCYATLTLNPGIQTFIMGFAMSLYVAFIIVTAVAHTRSLVRVVVAGSEVAKQQKTISLLLRDFEKHSSDWLWENRFRQPLCACL